jgi:hypothetical protein
MDTHSVDAALAELTRFPLLDALYGRRSRRFPMGGAIPDGRWPTPRATITSPSPSSRRCSS